MSTPQVVILDSQKYFGGGGTYKLDVIRCLQAQGIKSRIFLPPQSEFRQILKIHNIKTGDFVITSRLDFPGMLRLAWAFRGERDVILCTTDSITWYAGVFCRCFGHCQRYIAIIHIATAASGKVFPRWKRKIIAFIDRIWTGAYDTVICSTDFHKDVLLREGINPDKLAVVRNAVHISKVEQAALSLSRTEVLARMQIDPVNYIVGMFGRFGAGKDFPTLLKAIPLLLRSVPNVHFVLVGAGPQLPEIRDLTIAMGITDAVSFPGFISEEYYPLMASVDVVVNISTAEGIPYVLLDAMALSRPIIATDVGGIHEVVRSGDNGHLIPAGDPDILAEKLVELLPDKDLRIRYGRNSRSIIATEFRMDEMENRITGIFLDAR